MHQNNVNFNNIHNNRRNKICIKILHEMKKKENFLFNISEK
jgi:hypothetical protein